ncbi:hypothetical protein FSP39_004907 [Pinctada imbricata]|uniref:C2H2-type domain-containing protein n=1 Tax=Pinctada imbricata TaxID=66713 RepID=A0AA88Y371_PINIB|nr:hypothetical protein FSP39_004907 [Pinctada imbricata]
MHICQACGRFFSTTTEYRQHIQTHQGESAFLCLRCGMKYNAGEYYDKHYRHHKTCDCNLCTFTCDDQQELRGHILTDHNITWDGQPLSYKCEECGEKFSRRSLLEIHNKQHMDCKPIECQPCQLYFTSKKSLDIHKMSYRHSLKTGEAVNDEKKYLCSVCGKTYFRKHALQRHMLLHTGKKPHKCEHCNFRSYEVNNLKRHMALHFEAERNFVCEMCGAAFHARKTLEMHHTYKHNDVRAFACNMCDKTFKAKNTLVRHMKVHSSDKEHRCWCGTAFKRMYNLRRHLQTVHDNHDSHILPPVKRVKTLDTASKAPVSRTDHVQGFTARNKSRRVTNKKTNNECTRNVNKSTLDASHSINNFPNAVPHANLGYLAQKVHDSEIQEPVKQDFFTPILNSVTEQGKANLGLSTPTPLVTHDHMYYDHHVPNIPITTPPIQSNNISHPPTLPMGNSNTMSPLPAADTTLRTRFPSVESLYSNIPYPSSLDNGDSISIQGGSAISSGSHILKQLLNLY